MLAAGERCMFGAPVPVKRTVDLAGRLFDHWLLVKCVWLVYWYQLKELLIWLDCCVGCWRKVSGWCNGSSERDY